MIDKGEQFVSLKKHLRSLSELFAEGNEQGRQREKPGTGMNRSAGSSVINSVPISCAKEKRIAVSENLPARFCVKWICVKRFECEGMYGFQKRNRCGVQCHRSE